MKSLFACIGFLVIFCAVIGTMVPGMNFHVIFAGDKEAIVGHQNMAARIEKRLKEKDE